MGICPLFVGYSQQKSLQGNQEQTSIPGSTDRPLANLRRDNKLIHETVNDARRHSAQDVSLSNSKNESIHKHASTGIGLSECERKVSSIFSQAHTFESSIVVKSPKEKFGELNLKEGDFYTLIDKVFFVRKTMDKIKVASPHSESELNCPYKSLLSTLYLSEGLPLESTKEVSMGKVIQTDASPIRIALRLSCRDCHRKLKLTFAKSFIDLAELSCDGCRGGSNWRLEDITSNVPVWGDGRKIENNECLEVAPTPLRALGCIYCMKYRECEELPCECYACRACLAQSGTKECHICEAVE